MKINKGAFPINIWFLLITEFYSKCYNATETFDILLKYGYYMGSPKAMTTAFSNVRDAIKEFMLDQYSQHKMRGNIEIDESLISHGNIYHRNEQIQELLPRVQRQIWLVGFVARETNERRVFFVDDRSRDTLHELIKDNCERHSTIHTDGFRSYIDIDTL